MMSRQVSKFGSCREVVAGDDYSITEILKEPRKPEWLRILPKSTKM
jgi:hypothetical protein